MKRRLFIGFLLGLALLSACTQKPQVPEPAVAETSRSVETPSQALQSIDTQMWRQPDSALMRLLPWFDTCCRDAARHVSTASAYNRHYANLLLSELLYKNYYSQTNRRELQQAVAYFDSISQVPEPAEGPSNRIAFLDARAHYINGVGYYENDSAVEACKEYMKALEVMEDHFEEKELVGKKAKFMALTYTRLSSLFSDMYLHEQAIYFAQLSLASNQKLDVPSWHNAWLLCEIGIHYDIMERLDSADYYYKNATTLLNDTNCLLYRDISARQTVLKYKMRGLQKNTLTQLRHLINLANSKTECMSRSFTIGEIFYLEKQPDSAWYYLNNVYNNTERTAMKKQTAEWLVEICKAQGRDNEILEFASYLVPFANQEENQSEIKSQLTELYNSFRQATLSRQHQQVLKKNITISLMVFAGLIAGLIAYILLYHNNRRQKQHLEKQIKEEKQTHSMEKKALSSRLKKSNETLRELQDQIKQQNINSSIRSETQAATFGDEPICRLIMDRVHAGQFKAQINCSIYKDYALSKEQLVALQDAANRHFDLFTVRLVQAYPDITKSDLDYCCLHLLGLNDADMSALMQRAYNTINERNSKLRKVLGCKSSISAALKAFANNKISH